MQQLFLSLSSIIVFLAYFIYIRAILKGEAKPHRTTRLVLLVITGLAAFSLFAQQSQVTIWYIGICAVLSLIVFILSLKYGMGGWSMLDIGCMLIALFGIVIWKVTDDPKLALYAAIAADFVAVVPTLIKTYHHPETEVWTFYFLALLGSGFSLLAIRKWTIEESAYPLYLVVINIVLIWFIKRPQLKSSK